MPPPDAVSSSTSMAPHVFRCSTLVLAALAAAAFASLTALAGLGAAYADPVTGTVLDGTTMRPVPDATIVSAPPGAEAPTDPATEAPMPAPAPSLRATASKLGTFRLELPVGTTALTVSAPGY
jgi:hypothetical protein